MKLAVLEQRLLKEEHERKLVQEKAGQVSQNLLKLSDLFCRCSFHRQMYLSYFWTSLHAVWLKTTMAQCPQLQRELDLNLRLSSPPAAQQAKPTKTPQKPTLVLFKSLKMVDGDELAVSDYCEIFLEIPPTE